MLFWQYIVCIDSEKTKFFGSKIGCQKLNTFRQQRTKSGLAILRSRAPDCFLSFYFLLQDQREF